MNGMTKRVVVGETVALVAWLIVMLACQNVLMSPFVFYTSLLFGLLAFVASAVSMVLAGFGLSTVLSVGLFAVLLLVNTVFCFASFAWISTTLPVVVNVAILAAMVIVRVGLDSHAKTAQANVNSAAAKTEAFAGFSGRLGDLLAQVDEPEVRAALLALREDVSMSSNVSQPHVLDLEGEFASELRAIEASIQKNDPIEETFGLVAQARTTWRKRNAALTSIK